MKFFRILLVTGTALLMPLPCMGASQVGPRLKQYFKEAFFPHLWEGTKNTFAKPESLAWLAAGGGLTVIAHQYDWQVDDYWEDHEMDYGLSDFGNDFWGRGELQGAIALSMMLTGWQFENDRLADAGEVLAEAQIIQGLAINIIKPIANKERPDGSDNLSFPSGHTGTAFCTAAVLHDRYGWKLGLPAYAFAVITGLARMDDEKHWVSDVVMGAAIAMVTGYSVSRFHDDYPYEAKPEKPALALVPMVSDQGYGVVIRTVW